MISAFECIEFSITFNLHYLLVITISFLWHREVPTTKAKRPVGLMVLLMVPRVLQRMIVRTRKNNPKMPDHGTALVSTKQRFSFWNLLNFQLLLFTLFTRQSHSFFVT